MKQLLIAASIAGAFSGARNEATGAEGAGAPAAMTGPVSPIPNTKLEEYAYHFKKDKLGNKRDSVKLLIPVPTEDSVVEMLADEKQKALLLALLRDVVVSAGRDQVSDEVKPVNKQEELDFSKLSLAYIASIPPSERKGGGISKETWEAFSADYITVMQAVTGKSAEQVGNAAKLLVARLQPAKTNKPVLKFLNEQLALWFSNTQDAEEYTEVYEFLSGKIKTFLEQDDAALLANL